MPESEPQSSMKTKEQDKPWENPYRKNNNTSDVPSTSIPDAANGDAQNIVLNNVWTLDNLSPPDHKVPPIPSFYERIFPVHTPPSSPRPKTSTTENELQNTKQSMQPPKSNITEQTHNYNRNEGNDIEPYTISDQGVAHYRPQSSSSPITNNRTVTFGANQNPVSLPSTGGGALSQQKYPTASTPASSNTVAPYSMANQIPSLPTSNKAPIQSLNFINSSLSYDQSSSVLLSTEELVEIQNILRSLEFDSNVVPTIEPNSYMSTAHDGDGTVPYLSYGTSATDNQADDDDDHHHLRHPHHRIHKIIQLLHRFISILNNHQHSLHLTSHHIPMTSSIVSFQDLSFIFNNNHFISIVQLLIDIS